MAEFKVIDVSAWNTNVPYATFAQQGVEAAIIRITEKGNKVDSMFETHYKGFKNQGLKIGVYKYSYALSVAEIEQEAKVVVQTLNGRKLDYPIFLDLEWDSQAKLGAAALTKMTKAFRKIIVNAGYKFGIYCNVNWHDNILKASDLPYDWWLAAYPYNDNGTVQERLRPKVNFVGWQFTSKYNVNGKVYDMSIWNKDYSSTEKEETQITKEQAINTMIAIATNEVGYLEKKSNSDLDSKTGNAGSNNYTKYWRDVYPAYQAQAWCAAFVSWVFMKAYGLDMAKKLLKHWPYVYCPTLGGLFTKYANPEVGDIVIFWRNGEFAHTGIVTYVKGDYFETIEGNTSGGSTIVPNGGGVCKKSYYNSQLPGTKFCRPDYSIITNINNPTAPTKNYLSLGDTGSKVTKLQKNLNSLGYKGKDGKELTVDGDFGVNTDYAVRAFQKANKLSVDGQVGTAIQAKIKELLKTSTTTATEGNQKIKDAQIHLNNFTGSKLEITGKKNAATKKAYRKAIQIGLNKDYKCGLEVDGEIGPATEAALRKHVVRSGSVGYLVTVLEIGLLLNKYNPNGVESPGSFGTGVKTALGKFQKAKGLTVDYEAGHDTFMAMQK